MVENHLLTCTAEKIFRLHDVSLSCNCKLSLNGRKMSPNERAKTPRRRRSLFSIYQLCVGRARQSRGGGEKSFERVTHFLRSVIDAQWRHLAPLLSQTGPIYILFPSCRMLLMHSLSSDDKWKIIFLTRVHIDTGIKRFGHTCEGNVNFIAPFGVFKQF